MKVNWHYVHIWCGCRGFPRLQCRKKSPKVLLKYIIELFQCVYVLYNRRPLIISPTNFRSDSILTADKIDSFIKELLLLCCRIQRTQWLKWLTQSSGVKVLLQTSTLRLRMWPDIWVWDWLNHGNQQTQWVFCGVSHQTVSHLIGADS